MLTIDINRNNTVRRKILDDHYSNIVDWVLKILAGLATLFASKGVLTFIDRKLEAREKTKIEKGKQSHYETLVAMREVKECMEKISALSTVHRVLLLKGSNSGGIPVLGAPYYARAIDGSGEIDIAMENYKQVKVDLKYIQLLIDVMANKKITLDVSDLEPCLIRNIYTAEQVKKSMWYFVYGNDLEIIYMSVSTRDEFNSEDMPNIDIYANSIISIFESIYK